MAGPVTGDHVEALGDALSASGGIDATAQGDHRGGLVMFSREADDAEQAIISAIEDTEDARMTVTGVAEDQVSVRKTAERAKVSKGDKFLSALLDDRRARP